MELPETAVMSAVLDDETGIVAIEKSAETAPPGIVTVAGGIALGSLDERVTVKPLLGAGPLNVKVPVEDVPPKTVDGDKLKLERLVG